MNSKEIPMVPNRKASLPRVYGDTPSFLGVPVVDPRNLPTGPDVIVAGVPWEGTVTWGSFSSCELAPRSIRHASARYGGFLPEYEIDLFDHLQLGDMGDIPVTPNDAAETMANVHKAMLQVYRNRSIPFVLGGDHSFTPEIVRALGDAGEGDIGIIHFDAHLDNAKSFGADLFPRCGPLHRIAQLPRVRKESIVHMGIRGPRNSPAQYEYACSMGARIFTTREIRERGMTEVTQEAIAVAHEKTRHVFVTICSDCIDAGYNPGGPADFNGLLPSELLPALQAIGRAGIDGLDFVEVYPGQDPHGYSSHLAAWALIYALSGVAQRKKDRG
ncbi:agmatinase family protein [Geomonas subterranea]|uniref:Agmatinase family protein n=1 Tax=Geomonas subterranea TaxID=2847989 RepID=A0ABX8LDH3_9BACT|nr:agmatinase family protein [Geomonas subterranea]QXE89464.1 agmatinase family protein [Geomonas subterranea]QXM08420.1 agmatinase family protein [Geomonas subterranea]